MNKQIANSLKEVAASPYAEESWAILTAWIKNMVRVEPKIMREVSNAKFGDLGSWLDRGRDNVGRVCGCLVGTVALQLTKARNTYKPTGPGELFDGFSFERTTGPFRGETCGTPEVVASLVQTQFATDMKESAAAAGYAAGDLAGYLDNEFAVDLIKYEIKRQLALRNQRRRIAKAAKRNRLGQYA